PLDTRGQKTMELLPVLAFIMAFISLPMFLISRDVWNDRRQGLMWMALGVISAVVLMVWVWFNVE
ncbi:MAG: hypothetical protein QCI38_06165, partial [Candidatus Thermoplasmatota archaeon]|nr:hypothetical protein [Candidatus Thermoplasmatota archaeon]